MPDEQITLWPWSPDIDDAGAATAIRWGCEGPGMDVHSRASEGTEACLKAMLGSDLGFHGANTRRDTHAWHPFPAKFPPQLPGFFIEKLTDPGDVVLDPMAGSGTTVLEATSLGRDAVGCDIDPLARLIIRAKLTSPEPIAAHEMGMAVLNRARVLHDSNLSAVANELDGRFRDPERRFIDFWFAAPRQLELAALLMSMDEVLEDGHRIFFDLVFSSTIIAKTGGVSRARDLAHTRPHRVLGKRTNSAFTEFAKRLKTTLPGCARSRDVAVSGTADVISASAADTGLAADSADLIVTSPPYANNAIDYMRAHKFSLVWLGWPLSRLTRIRARCLGHSALPQQEYADLPDQCERKISELASADRRKSLALRRYFGEMRDVLKEMHRVLKPDCAAVLVVGSSVLSGVNVETDKGVASVGEAMGFKLVDIGKRQLDRDKRMMPTRWGRKDSQIEHRMHEEGVIGLIKP